MVERSSQLCPGKENNKSCSFASRLIVMIASAIVVVMFLSLAPDNLLNKRCGDCETYYVPIAKNLLAGQGLVTSNGRPALERPPGHALILATVIGIGRVFKLEQQKAVYIFNTLAISLSTVLLFSIARRYWGLMSSLIVAGLWGLNPFLLWFSNVYQ